MAPQLATPYTASSQKVISDCYGDVGMCNRFPDIEACSGTGMGPCALFFSNAEGQTLRVITAGGHLDEAQVYGWEVIDE